MALDALNSLSVQANKYRFRGVPGEWADLASNDGDGLEVAVKVHQWITLTREHATRAVDLWQKGIMYLDEIWNDLERFLVEAPREIRSTYCNIFGRCQGQHSWLNF